MPSDAQKIGDVFNAAVRQGWMYLGELAQEPMFPPDEWDQLIADHAPPNVLLVAVDELDDLECVSALPRIRKLLQDPHNDVRQAAATAVRNLEAAARRRSG